MEILHYCPAHVATGGTESIHKLVSEFNKIEGVHARLLYEGKVLSDPQPKMYESYNCEYITQFPQDFKGIVVFPEIWANRVVDSLYKGCVTAVNWAGVDVYDWNVPKQDRGMFLQNKGTIHLCQLEYAVDHLKKLGITNICRISDVLNDEFYEGYTEEQRSDTVLYNPVRLKMTQFERVFISRCNTELGVKFKTLSGYTREDLINLMRHSKLYIDFGVFSGRERLPRESAMCGCCVLTSNKGAAGYYEDVSIPDEYKFDIYDLDKEVDKAMGMVENVLRNYSSVTVDFAQYRESIRMDREMLPEQCRAVIRRFEDEYDKI